MNLINKYESSIKILCAKHKVKELYVFGSILGDNFNETSDIDFLVVFDKMELTSYTDNYFDFKFSLEDLLLHPIDLIEINALKNPYFKESVSNSRQLVYGN